MSLDPTRLPGLGPSGGVNRGCRGRAPGRKRNGLSTGGRLPLPCVIRDRLKIIVELRGHGFAHAMELFNDWVVRHGLMPINSYGVQIVGAAKPAARHVGPILCPSDFACGFRSGRGWKRARKKKSGRRILDGYSDASEFFRQVFRARHFFFYPRQSTCSTLQCRGRARVNPTSR